MRKPYAAIAVICCLASAGAGWSQDVVVHEFTSLFLDGHIEVLDPGDVIDAYDEVSLINHCFGNPPEVHGTIRYAAPTDLPVQYMDADTAVYYADDAGVHNALSITLGGFTFETSPTSSMTLTVDTSGDYFFVEAEADDADGLLPVFPGFVTVDAWWHFGFWSLDDIDGLGVPLDLSTFHGQTSLWFRLQDDATGGDVHVVLETIIDSITLVPAPEEQLVEMDFYITDQVALGPEFVAPELEGPLLSKVDAALVALNRGNPNDAKVAMNDLKALINQVEAQRDKKIDSVVADEIIAQANTVIASLEE